MAKKFSSVGEIAEHYKEMQDSLFYPRTPIKPIKDEYPSNQAYGEALDHWEQEKKYWIAFVKEYREACSRIQGSFKRELLEFLEISKHPRADRLFELAWEQGHSMGYNEVALHVEDLAKLLKD